jgi:hypothetical protein
MILAVADDFSLCGVGVEFFNCIDISTAITDNS